MPIRVKEILKKNGNGSVGEVTKKHKFKFSRLFDRRKTCLDFSELNFLLIMLD